MRLTPAGPQILKMKLAHRILLSFAMALGFAVGASLFGLAIALIAYPEGWQFLPVGCASIGWTLGFTLGLAYKTDEDHSPTRTILPGGLPIVERRTGKVHVPDGVGGWLLVDPEEYEHGQGQPEE